MGFDVDFRFPDGLGRRKRYVLFTRSPAVQARVANYFETVPLTPSEKTPRRRQESGSPFPGRSKLTTCLDRIERK